MNKTFLFAPMAEISHRAMRELIENFGGCDEYFSEMISAAGLLGGGSFEKWYIDNGPCPEKLVFQLVGADIGQISRAAALLDRLECRGIDINMGCCAPLIRKTGAGIAWMYLPSPEGAIDRAGELVKQVRKAVKRRLSAKIRLGPSENFEYLAQFCKRLEAEGLDFITLHPRTAAEKLKRRARWDYVGALRQELSIPVAGNGDIANAEELLRRAALCECDAVMVGRAAVRRPWIFAQAKGKERGGDWGEAKTISEITEIGGRFLELLARYQPPEFHISRARRFFGFFCDNLKWGNYVKNLLNREETLAGVEKVWIEALKQGNEPYSC